MFPRTIPKLFLCVSTYTLTSIYTYLQSVVTFLNGFMNRFAIRIFSPEIDVRVDLFRDFRIWTTITQHISCPLKYRMIMTYYTWTQMILLERNGFFKIQSCNYNSNEITDCYKIFEDNKYHGEIVNSFNLPAILKTRKLIDICWTVPSSFTAGFWN